MLTRRMRRTLAMLSAVVAMLMIMSPASAGRAWCATDPVLIINGDVVDIQVASSLAMYQSATGPIEMVVTVRRGTKAQVILQDFGFGHGYDIRIAEANGLKAGTRASVAVRAPASDSSLPVSVKGTRVSVDVAGILSLRPNLAWLGEANGSANQWVVIDVK